MFRVPAQAQRWVARIFAILWAAVGIYISTLSLGPAMLAFAVSLWAPLIAILLPKLDDRAMAVPLWAFFFLCFSLLSVSDPPSEPSKDGPTHDFAYFVFSLFAFTTMTIVAALDLRASRLRREVAVDRIWVLIAPAWLAIYAFFLIGGLLALADWTGLI